MLRFGNEELKVLICEVVAQAPSLDTLTALQIYEGVARRLNVDLQVIKADKSLKSTIKEVSREEAARLYEIRQKAGLQDEEEAQYSKAAEPYTVKSDPELANCDTPCAAPHSPPSAAEKHIKRKTEASSKPRKRVKTEDLEQQATTLDERPTHAKEADSSCGKKRSVKKESSTFINEDTASKATSPSTLESPPKKASGPSTEKGLFEEVDLASVKENRVNGLRSSAESISVHGRTLKKTSSSSTKNGMKRSRKAADEAESGDSEPRSRSSKKISTRAGSSGKGEDKLKTLRAKCVRIAKMLRLLPHLYKGLPKAAEEPEEHTKLLKKRLVGVCVERKIVGSPRLPTLQEVETWVTNDELRREAEDIECSWMPPLTEEEIRLGRRARRLRSNLSDCRPPENRRTNTSPGPDERKSNSQESASAGSDSEGRSFHEAGSEEDEKKTISSESSASEPDDD